MRIHPQDEKETLKSRQITLTLSDFEVDSICKEASSRGTTVEEILEDFVGNLVGGYHYRGSDESRLASEYLDRVIYSFDDDETFLQWLSNYGNLEDVALSFEAIEKESGKSKISRDEIEYQKQIIEEYLEEYLFHIGEERANKTNREEELQRVRDFIQSRRSLRGQERKK